MRVQDPLHQGAGSQGHCLLCPHAILLEEGSRTTENGPWVSFIRQPTRLVPTLCPAHIGPCGGISVQRGTGTEHGMLGMCTSEQSE